MTGFEEDSIPSCSSQNFFLFRSLLPDTTSAEGVDELLSFSSGMSVDDLSVFLSGLFFSSVLLCCTLSDLRESLFSFFSVVGVSSAGFLLVVGAEVVMGVVVVVAEAAGDDGAEAMDEAADAGLKFNNVFTSNLRFRSRLK